MIDEVGPMTGRSPDDFARVWWSDERLRYAVEAYGFGVQTTATGLATIRRCSFMASSEVTLFELLRGKCVLWQTTRAPYDRSRTDFGLYGSCTFDAVRVTVGAAKPDARSWTIYRKIAWDIGDEHLSVAIDSRVGAGKAWKGSE